MPSYTWSSIRCAERINSDAVSEAPTVYEANQGCNRNEEEVNASVDAQYSRAIRRPANGLAMSLEQTEAPIELQPVIEEHEQPVFDVPGYIGRLEASIRTALALVRRCIVEDKTPTREALAAEARFVFGMPGEAALAELDEVAQMMGISSLR
jgi:hypothetical protein